jgi:predicted metal-dependent hydrolase
LRQGRFVLPSGLAADGREHLVAWYRRRAEIHIGARVAHFAALTGVTPAAVTVKEMRSRWGSCTSHGRVSFHWGLVLLPPAIVDYVVVHELAHLRELNHGPRFWRLVEEIVPDYHARRAWLRGAARRYAI